MPAIWIVNPFDNLPEEGAKPQRYALLAREFARRGHDVVWWTSAFSHSRKDRRRDPSGAPLPPSWRGRDGVGMRLVEAPPYASNVSLARVRNHRAFAANLLARAVGEIEDGGLAPPDAVIASTPPLSSFGAAEALRRKFGTRIAVDMMDAWPDAFASLLPLPPRAARAAVRLLLAPLLARFRRELRMADVVTATSESYLALARQLGSAAPMAAFHHTCGSVAERRPCPSAGGGAPLRMLYSGNMGRQYDLGTLVAAMGILRERGVPVSLELAGSGPAEGRVRRLAADIPCVSFLGFLDAAGLDAALSRADVGVIPLLPSSAVAIPYKLPDYSSRGLAIVECLGGETGALVASHGAGLHYPARDPAALADAIASLAADRAGLSAMQAGAARMARSEFLASAIYPAFARFIEDAIARGGAGRSSEGRA